MTKEIQAIIEKSEIEIYRQALEAILNFTLYDPWDGKYLQEIARGALAKGETNG